MSRIVPYGEVRQREPRVRDKAYLGWVARLPCIACACRGRTREGVHVAHIRMGVPGVAGWREVGKSEKPSDHRTAPLCPSCHLDGPDAQHRMSERAFWERLNIWPPAFCAALQKACISGEDGRQVIRQAARGEFSS